MLILTLTQTVVTGIAKVINSHEDDPGLTKRCCDALRYMCAVESNKDKFGANNMCELLTTSLQSHIGSHQCSQFLCRAIGHLAAYHPKNQADFAKFGGVEGVKQVILKHAGSEEVCTEACWAIRNIGSKSRMIDNKTGNLVDSLISIFMTGGGNDVLTGECCRALLSLIESESDPLTALYFNAGAAKAAMKAVARRPDSDYVAKWCFNLLAYMCYDDSTRRRLISSNILEQLAPALQQHSGNEGVAEWCCKCVHLLSQVDGATIKMKAAGLCETVVGALQRQSASRNVCEWAANAIGDLATDRDNRNRLGECGAGEAVVFALKRHDGDSKIAYKTCYAIHWLAVVANNSSWIRANGGCEAVTRALIMHTRDSVEVAQLGCRAIGSLANREEADVTGKANLERLRLCGAIEAVVVALRTHEACAEVAEFSCRAMHHLGYDTRNISPLGKVGACEMAVAALKKHIANDLVVRQAFMAIYSLATRYNGIEHERRVHERNMTKLVSSGVLAAVVTALEKHKSNAQVMSAGAMAVSSLARKDTCRDQLGQLKACDAIVATLARHKDNEFVVKECALAIEALAADHEVNKSKLCVKQQTGQDCVDILLHSLLIHEKSAGVNYACMKALVTMSSHESAKIKVRQTDACTKYCNNLKKHEKEVEVVRWCSQLISTIATDEATRNRFALQRAPEILVPAFLKNTDSESVSEWAFRAIVTLSASETNKSKFFTQETFDCCSKALKTNCHNPQVSEWGCAAIASLANVEMCRSKLGNSGACAAIGHALAAHQESEAVSSLACDAIANLGLESTNKALLGVGGACEAVVKALETHSASLDVCKYVVRAIAVLAYGNKSNIDKLVKTGVCELLPEATVLHPHTAPIAHWVCHAIACVADQNKEHQDKLADAKACDAVVNSMQRHRTHEGLMKHACRAIRSLAYKHEGNKKTFGDLGVFSNVLTALKTHSAIESVVEDGCWALGCITPCDSVQDATLGEIFRSASAWEVVTAAMRVHEAKPSPARWACTAISAMADAEVASFSKSGSGLQAHSIAQGGPFVPLSPVASTIPIMAGGVSPLPFIGLGVAPSTVAVATGAGGQMGLSVDGNAVSNIYGAASHLAACELVVSALVRHTQSEQTVQRACSAIASLAQANVENQVRFGRLNACEVLTSVLEKFHLKEAVLQAACSAISALAKNKPDHQAKFNMAETCRFLVRILHQHIGDKDVVKQGCKAIVTLSGKHIGNRGKLIGACTFLGNMLEAYSAFPDMTIQILEAVSSLSHQHVSNRSKLGLSGACKSVLVVLKLNFGKLSVVIETCKCIANLSANHPNNIAKLGSMGVCEALIDILKKFALPKRASVTIADDREPIKTEQADEIAAIQGQAVRGLKVIKWATWAIANLVQAVPEIETKLSTSSVKPAPTKKAAPTMKGAAATVLATLPFPANDTAKGATHVPAPAEQGAPPAIPGAVGEFAGGKVTELPPSPAPAPSSKKSVASRKNESSMSNKSVEAHMTSSTTTAGGVAGALAGEVAATVTGGVEFLADNLAGNMKNLLRGNINLPGSKQNDTISENQVKNIVKMEKAGVVDVVVFILRSPVYNDDPSTVQWSCRLVTNLAKYKKSIRAKFVEEGTLIILEDLLIKFAKIEAVAEWIRFAKEAL